MLLDELSCLESRRDDLTQDEHIRRWQILVALGMAIGQDGIDNLDLPRGGGARGPHFNSALGGGGGGGKKRGNPDCAISLGRYHLQRISNTKGPYRNASTGRYRG